MSLLAIDAGSKSGWAVIKPPYRPFPTAIERGNGILPPAPDMSGAKNFSSFTSHDARFLAFSNWFVELIMQHSPDKVVFEAPLRAQDSASSMAAQLGNGWRAIILLECERFDIPRWHVTGSAVKSMALDRKRPPKGQAKSWMMNAATKMGWTFKNDDECDAQWIATYAANIFADVTDEKIAAATKF